MDGVPDAPWVSRSLSPLGPPHRIRYPPLIAVTIYSFDWHRTNNC